MMYLLSVGGGWISDGVSAFATALGYALVDLFAVKILESWGDMFASVASWWTTFGGTV